MSHTRLSMPVDSWPIPDRERWSTAMEPADFFDDRATPASEWSEKRRRIVCQSYGQWLAWLNRHGLLQPDAVPGERVTTERVKGFVTETAERVAPTSMAMMLGAFVRMLDVLEPEMDWNWLRRLAQRLKVNAEPVRNKRELVVPAKDLYDLGIGLMETAHAGRGNAYSAAMRFRDGLIIALLAARPLRMRNLSSIEMGRNLIWDNGRHLLSFDAEETKNGNALHLLWPESLEASLEAYLIEHRALILLNAGSGADARCSMLWVSRWGRAMSAHGLHEQIKLRTREAFGRPINPHLFRDCVATSIAIDDPSNVRTAAAILGHTAFSTTEKYYNQATSLEAGRHYQAVLEDVRRANDCSDGS